jgi:hypothetical protein
MKTARLLQSALLLVSGLGFPSAWADASNINTESDAMQITTHFNDLTGIACDSAGQYCVAAGVKHHPNSLDHIIYTTNNGGIHWNPGIVLTHPEQEDKIEAPNESTQNFMTIRCNTSGQDCLLAGTTSISNHSALLTYTSHDGGRSWSTPNVVTLEDQIIDEDYPAIRLKCDMDINACILATNTIQNNRHVPVFYTTQTNGATWTASPTLSLPSQLEYGIRLLDIGCDQHSVFCTALMTSADDDNLIYDNTRSPASLSPIPFIYSTHNGGITWSVGKPFMVTEGFDQDPILSIHDVPNIISCDQSGLSCIALGTHYTTKISDHDTTLTESSTRGYTTKNGGLNWQKTSDIFPAETNNSQNIFTALHCDITNRFCAAVGINISPIDGTDEASPIIYTSTDSGQTWQKKSFTPVTDFLNIMFDVFCSEDAALCHAVGILIKPE